MILKQRLLNLGLIRGFQGDKSKIFLCCIGILSKGDMLYKGYVCALKF